MSTWLLIAAIVGIPQSELDPGVAYRTITYPDAASCQRQIDQWRNDETLHIAADCYEDRK